MVSRLQDKFRGVLLGMACGDALGAQVEFMQRGTFPLQVDMVGGGPHRLQAGQWTDDTAMALHLAERLLEDPRLLHPGRLAKRWVAWHQRGDGSCTGTCFDIGTQTAGALTHWARFGKAPHHSDPLRRGNGALMRVAPVALSSHGSIAEARHVAMVQALVTHPTTCAKLCAEFVSLLQVCTIWDNPRHALEQLYLRYPQQVGRSRDAVVSSGYDVATIEAAIWAVGGAESLEDAVVRAVNLGDDADTAGAVAGALAGAVWGGSEVPSRWLEKLAWGDRIMGTADVLYDRLSVAGAA